jgi:phycobilisome rod-core linker protein
MSLPLLELKPLAQNARVRFISVGNEEDARRTPEGVRRSSQEMDELIERAYRQIYFHAFKVDREPGLESQLRRGQISTRQFIRGLLLSDKFRRDFYRCNSNYDVVEQVVGRVLGRPVHGERERIAWSILIAAEGLESFVDALLESPEYLDSFGEDEVPFQRSRVLPGRGQGMMPFNQQAPRYSSYWREVSATRAPAGGAGWGNQLERGLRSPAWANGEPPKLAQTIWLALAAIGGVELVRILLTTAGAMLSTGSAG